MRKTALIVGLILITASLLTNVQAQSLINFYIQENEEVDVVGVADFNPEIKGIDFKDGKVFGTSSELVKKEDRLLSFNLSLAKEADVVIYLPENAFIKNIEGNLQISKINDRLVISSKTSKVYFEYVQETNYSWVILLAILLALIWFYFIKKNRQDKKRKKIDKLKIIKDVLNEREKAIIEKLKEYKTNNIKIQQKQLRKILQIPKASFSRHIQELEKKKLIERKGEGKNKFLNLR